MDKAPEGTAPRIHRKFRIRPLLPHEKGFPFWKDVMEEYYIDDNGNEIPKSEAVKALHVLSSDKDNHDNCTE